MHIKNPPHWKCHTQSHDYSNVLLSHTCSTSTQVFSLMAPDLDRFWHLWTWTSVALSDWPDFLWFWWNGTEKQVFRARTLLTIPPKNLICGILKAHEHCHSGNDNNRNGESSSEQKSTSFHQPADANLFREHVWKQRVQSQRLHKTHRNFQIKTQELD